MFMLKYLEDNGNLALSAVIFLHILGWLGVLIPNGVFIICYCHFFELTSCFLECISESAAVNNL